MPILLDEIYLYKIDILHLNFVFIRHKKNVSEPDQIHLK